MLLKVCTYNMFFLNLFPVQILYFFVEDFTHTPKLTEPIQASLSEKENLNLLTLNLFYIIYFSSIVKQVLTTYLNHSRVCFLEQTCTGVR